jgi:ApaG protein
METLVTAGIRVSVETFYQPGHSNPRERRYVYAYRITIHNENKGTVQLLRRHWHIRDSNKMMREVEGEGVIGEQPLIEPGQSHQYVSWTQLFSDIGKMYGVYLMKNLATGSHFEVRIPEFTLVEPSRLN